MNNISMAFKIDDSDKYAATTNKEILPVSGDIITEAGRSMLLDKISRLFKRKPEISERIAAARSQGGLEENEELHGALEDMQRIDIEIYRLQSMLDGATLLPTMKSGDYNVVALGTTVTIKNLDNNRIVSYTILGEVESDPSAGIISFKSPLGKELLGSKVGDFIDIERGDDFIEYEILKIFVK